MYQHHFSRHTNDIGTTTWSLTTNVIPKSLQFTGKASPHCLIMMIRMHFRICDKMTKEGSMLPYTPNEPQQMKIQVQKSWVGQSTNFWPKFGLADNCQILAVRSDICKIGQLSDWTTVSADNCQIGQLSVRTTVSGDNCQCGQLSVGQLSVGHGQLSEETVSALKKL